MRRALLNITLVMIFITMLAGCGLKYHRVQSKKNNPVRIDSNPSGANFTVFDKTGNPVNTTSRVTPANISWTSDYSYVRFEMTGYPTKQARLKRNKFNKRIWYNVVWAGVGAGIRFIGPAIDDTPKTKRDLQNVGSFIMIAGGVGMAGDIVTTGFLTKTDNITVSLDKTETPLFWGRNRRQGIERVLRKAITESTAKIKNKDVVIAVLDLNIANRTLKDYITGETEYILVSSGFRVVDRGQLDRIRAEQRFQLSGEIDENTAVEIGKFTGADYILTGGITGFGEFERLSLRLLDTRTAHIEGSASEKMVNITPLVNPPNIETAILRAIDQSAGKVAKNSKIAIVQVSAEPSLQAFITGEAEFELVQRGYKVVDRAQLDRIRAEQEMHYSGEIDDATAASLGKLSGADFIVTIRIDGQGALTRLRWRVLNTQTALVAGVASVPFDGVFSNKKIEQNLENAMRVAFQQATQKVSKQANMAIVQILATDRSHRDFIANEGEHLLYLQGFRLVDRARLDTIRREQGFQQTAEVDDNTAVNIGYIAGAAYIVTGRIDGDGSLRRLRLRVLDTQTAEVVGVASVRF